jgi:uncharacterized protein YbbK (DUF523 family)
MPNSAFPSPETIAAWPDFTAENPLRVFVSGCLAGNPVGYDGSTYGQHLHIAKLIALPNVCTTAFCPENFVFGTPRLLCDIHGGDGHDVLAGRARVLASNGEDWTARMIAAAKEMLRQAKDAEVLLAILMDTSAACGSQVIYAGTRPNAPHRIGQGVCAALLAEEGIAVVSQRDFKTLALVFRKAGCKVDFGAVPKDHHEIDWYRAYFGEQAQSSDESHP